MDRMIPRWSPQTRAVCVVLIVTGVVDITAGLLLNAFRPGVVSIVLGFAAGAVGAAVLIAGLRRQR